MCDITILFFFLAYFHSSRFAATSGQSFTYVCQLILPSLLVFLVSSPISVVGCMRYCQAQSYCSLEVLFPKSAMRVFEHRVVVGILSVLFTPNMQRSIE